MTTGPCRALPLEGNALTDSVVRIDGLDIEYTDRGTGPTVMFVHGLFVTGAVWNDVVTELGHTYRCPVPTWPLVAHRTSAGSADLTAEATARRIVHFMDAQDLRDVTVVANDTDGGLVPAALGDTTLDKTRIAKLVLTNCDRYEHFLPGASARTVKISRLSPALGGEVLRLLATGPGQRFFLRSVCRRTPTAQRQREIIGSFARDKVTRRDAARVTASLDPALTMRAVAAIKAFDKRDTLAWGTKDQLFPVQHAIRLRDGFPAADLIECRQLNRRHDRYPIRLAAAISSS